MNRHNNSEERIKKLIVQNSEIFDNENVLEIKKVFLKEIMQIVEPRFTLFDIYPYSDSLKENLAQIDDLKKCLDSFRPLEGLAIEKLNKYFEELYTYESNGIEGNTLTLQETSLIINHGITIGGKSLREHFEVINHTNAIEYIQEIAKEEDEFNSRILLDIHALILDNIDKQNAGRYRQVDVMIGGSTHIPPQHIFVSELMTDYFAFYTAHKTDLHPVLLAADMHEKLVTIHPFVDGNGRTSRLVMNLLLIKQCYPITQISSENSKREEYYEALEKTQVGINPQAFQLFIAQNVKKSLIAYLDRIVSNGEPGTKGEYFYKRYLELKNKA